VPNVDGIWFANYFSQMSGAENMQCMPQTQTEAETLAECDQGALERFQMLDAMEAGENVTN
jgi:hypothetical protein